MAGTLTVQNLQGPTSGANANKIIVSSGQTLDASAGFKPPAGTVIQVKQAVFTGTMVRNSASFGQVTGLSVDIIPTSASSKFMITFHAHATGYTGNEHAHLRIMRDSTVVGVGDAAGSRGQSTTATGSASRDDAIYMASMSYLDSPNTTSQITYSLHVRAYDGSGANNAYINRSLTDPDMSQMSRPISTFTVMEIAG
jgi:hypothetical protein